MDARKIMLAALLIALSLGLLIGCSKITPTDPGTTGQKELEVVLPPDNPTPYQYPEAANHPPAGYQFLHPAPNQNPSTNSLFASMMIDQSLGGILWLNGSCAAIMPWALHPSQRISMAQPNTNELYLDFETHGLFFDGPQYARISYEGWQIPPDLTPQDLVVWYWNSDTGAYEYIGGVNNLADQYLEFNIYHFSRYVVAGPNH